MRFCLVFLCLVLLLACGDSTPTSEHASAVVPNTATTTGSPAGTLETESATPASPGEPAVVHPTATPAPSPTPITTSLTPTVTLLPSDQQKPSLRDRPMLAAFVKGGRGWAIAPAEIGDRGRSGSALYRTTDGGATWARVATAPPDPEDSFDSVFPFDAKRLILITRRSYLLSEDGGLTLRAVSPRARHLPSVHFASPERAAGLAGNQVYVTADSGRSWTQVGTSGRLAWATIEPAGRVWIVTRDCGGAGCSPTQEQPVLRSTADAGRSWTQYDLGPISPASVQFATDQRGRLYAWDEARRLSQEFVTEDSGQSWSQIQ